jgi:VanZ family protein
MNTQDLPHRQASAEWSNRILLLSLIGIAYLTLFPFRFDFSPSLVLHRFPFFLDSSLKRPHGTDFFLNILLFVPFGLGVSARARKRGRGRWTALLLALGLGAAVSYSVELLQFYIPERDSGWEDVFSNSTGSVAGFFLFEICGGALLANLSKCEDWLRRWLSPRRAVAVLVAYFAISLGLTFQLQYETRLSDWDPRGILFVGNDASGQNPWKGQIFQLQIWNRALPADAIRQIVAQGPAANLTSGLLASYNFAMPAPYLDERNFLPALGWTATPPQVTEIRGAEFHGGSWLSTKAPVGTLTREIKQSTQMTVRVICEPAATDNAGGRIVSISQPAGYPNFHLRQRGADLVFWFRNPLLEKRSVLGWDIGALAAGKPADIVASYDGSSALIYVDGNAAPEAARPSAGTIPKDGTAYVQVTDLKPYVVVYETILFLPAGLLIGIAAGTWSALKISDRWILAAAWGVPPLVLEILFAQASGRGMWLRDIAFSLVFGLAGILLMNADRGFRKSSQAS